MFTEQHYVRVAKMFQFERLDIQDGASAEGSLERLIERFADFFQMDGVKFDKKRFIRACGGE